MQCAFRHFFSTDTSTVFLPVRRGISLIRIFIINHFKSQQKNHKTWHLLFRLLRSLRGTDLSCHFCWHPGGRQRWRSLGLLWSLLRCFDWSSSLAPCFSYLNQNIFDEVKYFYVLITDLRLTTVGPHKLRAPQRSVS